MQKPGPQKHQNMLQSLFPIMKSTAKHCDADIRIPASDYSATSNPFQNIFSRSVPIIVTEDFNEALSSSICLQPHVMWMYA